MMNPSKLFAKRLEGTALFYALLITTLIGILLTALISIWIYYRGAHQRDLAIWESIESVESAFLYAQSEEGIMDQEYFPFSTDSILMTKRPWGFFELISCTPASPSSSTITKTALLGRKSPARICLEMLDTRKALALSGTSQLIGQAIVPRGGITTTTVNGVPFQSGQAIIGSSSSGDGALPSLDLDVLNNTQPGLIHDPYNIRDLADSFHLSFTQTPILIKGKVLELERQNWSGPIVLEADSLIRIGGKARLNGLILRAPSIEIDTGFTGQLQAIASLEITLGTQVYLTYPSVLAVLPKSSFSRRQSGRLRIGKDCKIEGTLLGLKNNSNDADDQQLLATLQQTELQGRVIWQGGLEFSGQIAGSVYCDNFFYRGNSGQFFFNYLVNGRIDAPSRSEHWVEPMIWNTGNKAVAQWLD
ncbi:hypothetical protein [Lewinella sp. LCG006]|uniref:hypothetical protein n=1 Tax=Lewinella sp. LCG006 TaxID=3231911 RepID=UPI0034606629